MISPGVTTETDLSQGQLTRSVENGAPLFQ